MNRLVNINGLDVHYRMEGDSDRLPVVLIHAYPANLQMWNPQLSVLASSFRTLAYDVRGFGKSTGNGFPFTMENLVEDLIGLLDHLGIPRAVLCGLSMGGYIALRTVWRNPERVAGLVLCNTRSEGDGNEVKLSRHLDLQLMKHQGLSAFTENFLRKFLAPQTFQKKPETVQKLMEWISANRVENIASATLALISRLDTTEVLPKIQVPTLFLHGELDGAIAVSVPQTMKKMTPGSELFLIPHAGHFSSLENPEKFNLHLLHFLKKFSFSLDPKEPSIFPPNLNWKK